MPKECPPQVIETGKALIKVRKSAASLSAAVEHAIAALGPAIDVMVKEHGAKVMQAGETLALLRKIQMAEGEAMAAHNKLRSVLCDCDVAEPTDEQVLSIR
jgi:N-acetylglucosamine kinase-like BadF-type ATPase